MLRKFIVLLLGLTLAVSSTVSVFASETQKEPNISAKALDHSPCFWKPVKRSDTFEEKSRWVEAMRFYTNGKAKGAMACATKISVSSSYKGELKISIPELESYALMEHKINRSFTSTTSYSESLKGKSKGTYALYVRKVYKCRKITQRKYEHLDGKIYKTKTTKIVQTKDFNCMSYKLKKISNKGIT